MQTDLANSCLLADSVAQEVDFGASYFTNLLDLNLLNSL